MTRLKRSLLIFALFLITAFAPVSSSWATSPPSDSSHYLDQALLDGTQVQRWNDSMRTIRVTLLTNDTIPGWRPELKDMVIAAFKDWETALDGKYHFEFTEDPSTTDILVMWNRYPNGLQIGQQFIRWTNKTLTDADIEISLYNPKDRLLTDSELKYVALHEIGHVLGIRGHSSVPGDIMYVSLQPNLTKLSPRDIATVRALYRLKPDITNPHSVHLAQYQQFEYYISLGYEAHKAKDYKNAYKYFLKAHSLYPNESHIAYYLGVSAYNLQNYDVAIINLNIAVQISNDDQASAAYYLANSLMALGANEIQTGNRDEGIALLKLARQYYGNVLKNPKTPEELRNKASNYLSKISSLSLQSEIE